MKLELILRPASQKGGRSWGLKDSLIKQFVELLDKAKDGEGLKVAIADLKKEAVGSIVSNNNRSISQMISRKYAEQGIRAVPDKELKTHIWIIKG